MKLLAQLKREFTAIFVSPIAYVLIAVTLVINDVIFGIIMEVLSGPYAPPGAPMQSIFGGTIFYYIMILVLTPFITMRLFSQEKAAGTLETLMTAPIGEAQVVVAKYLASVGFYVIMWLPTVIYPLILSRYSDVDLGPVLSGYLGTIGMGMMFLAVGLLASTLTRSQIVAALLSFCGNMVLFLLGIIEFINPSQSSDSVIGYMNLWNHMEAFGRGIVDTRYLVYYGSVTLFVLFCTVQVLQARRWR